MFNAKMRSMNILICSKIIYYYYYYLLIESAVEMATFKVKIYKKMGKDMNKNAFI